jgi:hypothetical protein
MSEEPCGIANGATLEEAALTQIESEQEVLQLQASTATSQVPKQKTTQVNIFYSFTVQKLQVNKNSN